MNATARQTIVGNARFSHFARWMLCKSFGMKKDPHLIFGSTCRAQSTAQAVKNKTSEDLMFCINDRVTTSRLEMKSGATGVVKVELSRPTKLNSLDIPMFEAITETAKRLRNDKSIRAAILCGAGRAFCSGLDVKSVASHDWPSKTVARLLDRPRSSKSPVEDGDGQSQHLAIPNLAQEVGYAWRGMPFPVIAAIHGVCFGGGLQIALGADMRYSTPDCRFSVMETKWGLIPDMSITVTMRELVRMDVAKELTMTGRIFEGTEAAELGLVTKCVDDPLHHAITLAEEIVKRSPDAVTGSKRLFQETWHKQDEQACLEFETQMQRYLVPSWNQGVASLKNFGLDLPYKDRMDFDDANSHKGKS